MKLTTPFLTLLILALILISCDQIERRFGSGGDKEQRDTLVQVDSGITEALLLTRVDQLRMRRYPDIKSNVVTTLDDNMPVRYLDEETDYEESIGGSKGTWKRVVTLDGDYEGWIYGAKGFIEWMLTPETRDSILATGQGIRAFGNLTKQEFATLSGSSLSGESVGARYSGWYPFTIGSDPKVIDATIRVVSKVLDTESKRWCTATAHWK
jgi:hypothetical protein